MPKILKGQVVKKSSSKTVKVAVSRTVRHPIYKKRYSLTKNYLVHDDSGKHKVGDTVTIIETKPISKRKRFKITQP